MRKISYILGLILLISALLSSCADSKADKTHVTLPTSVSSDQNLIIKPEIGFETEDAQTPQTTVHDENEPDVTQPELDAADVNPQLTTEQSAINSDTSPISTSPTTAGADSQTVPESKSAESSSDYEDGIVSPDEENHGIDQDIDDFTYIEPPCMLQFANYSEYSTLIKSVNFSDEEFKAFVDMNNYSMNGISQKTDVARLEDMMNGLPLPNFENMELAGITIYPYSDRDYYTVFYRSASGVNAVIDIKTKKCSDVDMAQKITAAGDSNEKVAADNAEVFYADSSDGLSRIYYVYVGGYDMTAVVRNAEKNVADAAFSNISFEYFSK